MALSLPSSTGYYSKEDVKTILNKRIQRERRRSIEYSMKCNGDSLPEDVLIEIFSWLPVRSLLQLKVVCKLWYTIIKDSSFISKHLKNYTSNNDDFGGCLIVQKTVTPAGELNNDQLLIIHKDNTHKLLAFQEVSTPEYNTFMCGPCDGMFYVWCFYKEHDRFIWNPALNEFKRLPPLNLKPNHLPSHINFYYNNCEHYGFGYDPIMKDYKIIVIERYCDTSRKKDLGEVYDANSYPLSIFIYSLRNGCWSYWGDLSKHYYLRDNRCYVFVNNSVYWLGSLKQYDCCVVLISFNLATNSVKELQLPNYEKLEISDDERLVVCYESVGLLVNYHEKRCFKIWVLSEGLWTMKCIVDDLGYMGDRFDPIGHWKENKLIFHSRNWERNLMLYDLDTQESVYLGYRHFFYDCENICAYNESLVSIDSLKDVGAATST